MTGKEGERGMQTVETAATSRISRKVGRSILRHFAVMERARELGAIKCRVGFDPSILGSDADFEGQVGLIEGVQLRNVEVFGR